MEWNPEPGRILSAVLERCEDVCGQVQTARDGLYLQRIEER